MPFRKSAFSLLEVSITLILIGILIAATVSARALIKNARIVAQQAKTRAAPINSIPNTTLWYEASLEKSFATDEIEDGVELSGWNDIKSGSAQDQNNALAVVGVNKPRFSAAKSGGAVKFNASDDTYFNINVSNISDSDYTILFIEKRQGSGSNYFLGDPSASTAGESLLLGYNASGSVIHSHDGASGGYTASVEAYTTSKEKPRIFTFIQNAATGKYIYINGFLAAHDTNKDKLTNISTLKFGKGFTGEIGEMVVFDRALKGEERKAIEKYLQEKWKININSISTDGADCTSGTVGSSGCSASCSVSIVGESTTSLADGESEDFDCDQDGYVDTVSSHTCSGGAAIVDSCGVVTCDITGITGVADVTKNYGSGALTCQTGYEGSMTYNCASNGSASTSGTCSAITCSASSGSGYSSQSGLAYAESGSGSFDCDTGYDGSINYTCTTSGAATITGGSCTSSSASGVNYFVAVNPFPGNSSTQTEEFESWFADNNCVISDPAVGANPGSYTFDNGTITDNSSGYRIWMTTPTSKYWKSSGWTSMSTSSATFAASIAAIGCSQSTIQCSAPSGTGYNAQSGLNYAPAGSGSFDCDATGYSGTMNYTCTTNGAVATITGGSCAPTTCTLPSDTGYQAQSGLAYAESGSGSFDCDVSGYSGTINYTCTTTGVATVTGGSCSATSTGSGDYLVVVNPFPGDSYISSTEFSDWFSANNCVDSDVAIAGNPGSYTFNNGTITDNSSGYRIWMTSASTKYWRSSSWTSMSLSSANFGASIAAIGCSQ